MNARHLVVALAAAGGVAFWFTHRGLTEARVVDFYAAQVDAFAREDRARLCAQYAPDYQGTDHVTARGGAQVLHSDKDLACKSVDFLFEFKKRFDARQTDGGVLATEYHVSPADIVVARDGKSADVHVQVHVDFGGAYVADSQGTEHLVLRGGKVLTIASEMTTQVSGPLALGAEPASLMTGR